MTTCRFTECPRPVVGHSTTGKGMVCKGHNEEEWGRALRTYDPPLSRRLLADAKRTLAEAVLV